jgi:coenzyme PQQ precursor peptide PqqA
LKEAHFRKIFLPMKNGHQTVYYPGVSGDFERMDTMEWTAPKFEEVALNCEINSYASAAL